MYGSQSAILVLSVEQLHSKKKTAGREGCRPARTWEQEPALPSLIICGNYVDKASRVLVCSVIHYMTFCQESVGYRFLVVSQFELSFFFI